MTVLALTEIATAINEQHARASADALSALERARHCGELLLEAKSQLDHGAWLPWIESHLTFSARQAQKYMRLAEQWLRVANANSDSYIETSIDAVLASIADPRERVECTEVIDPPVSTPAPRRQSAPIVVDNVSLNPAPMAPEHSEINSKPSRAAVQGSLVALHALPPKTKACRPDPAVVRSTVAVVLQHFCDKSEELFLEVVAELVARLDADQRAEIGRRMAAMALRNDIAAIEARRHRVQSPFA